MSNLSSYHLGVVVVATHLKKKQTATVKSSQNRGEGFQQMVVFFFAHSKWINPNCSWNCGSLDLPKRIPSHPSLIHSEVTGVGFLYVVLIQTYLLRLGITGEVFIRRILSNCNWKDVSMIFLFLLLLEQNQTSEQSMQCLRN